MNNNRIFYLDIAKGFLILLLLVSHFGIVVRESKINVQESYFAGIYFFHPLFTTFFMQCFFLISGYCSNFNHTAKVFFYKQLKEIIVPSIFLGAINGLYHYIYGSEHQFYVETFWFLNSLFCGKVFCWIVNKLKIEVTLYFLISFLLFLLGITLNNYDIGENIFSIRQCLTSGLFVAMGMFFKKNLYIHNYLMKYSWCLYVIIFSIIYTFNQESRVPIIDGTFHKFSFYKTPLVVIISIIGSFTIFRICQIIGRFHVIEFFGRNSLIIYCIHLIPFLYIIQLTSQIFLPHNTLTGTIFYLVALAMEIITMTIIIKLFNYPLLRICIGKW